MESRQDHLGVMLFIHFSRMGLLHIPRIVIRKTGPSTTVLAWSSLHLHSKDLQCGTSMRLETQISLDSLVLP